MREPCILCGTMQFVSGWRRVRGKLIFSCWQRMQAHQSINWKDFISNTWNWLRKRDRTSIPLQGTDRCLSDYLSGWVGFVVCVLTNPIDLHWWHTQRFWQPIFRNVLLLWCEVERISKYGGQQGILYERVSFFCFISIGNELLFLHVFKWYLPFLKVGYL